MSSAWGVVGASSRLGPTHKFCYRATITIPRFIKDVHFDEIDPIRLTIGPDMIRMTPLTLAHNHYSITLASRGGFFRERLSIRQINTKVIYAIGITKGDSRT